MSVKEPRQGLGVGQVELDDKELATLQSKMLHSPREQWESESTNQMVHVAHVSRTYDTAAKVFGGTQKW